MMVQHEQKTLDIISPQQHKSHQNSKRALIHKDSQLKTVYCMGVMYVCEP
jgi:hypothetical protein